MFEVSVTLRVATKPRRRKSRAAIAVSRIDLAKQKARLL
jgi:hypothetical protein